MTRAPRARTEAIRALSQVNSLADVAAYIGVTPQRISKILSKEVGYQRQASQRPSAVDPLRIVRAARSSGVINIRGVIALTGGDYPLVSDTLDKLGLSAAVSRLWRLRKHRQTQARKEEFSEQLRMLARQLGRTPNLVDINQSDITPCHVTYVKAFGGISNAQRAAGLTPNGTGYQGHKDKTSVRRARKRKRKSFRHVVCVTERELLKHGAE